MIRRELEVRHLDEYLYRSVVPTVPTVAIISNAVARWRSSNARHACFPPSRNVT